MTEELFLRDAYLKEFEARVVDLSGREVVLDRTAFYPGGGGQPVDKGTLGVGPINANVVDARREGGRVVHVLDNAIPETVRELKGSLDWERRYACMRYHGVARALRRDLVQLRREGYGRPDAPRPRTDGLLVPRRVDG